jgi:hypothetical protein
MSYQIIMIAKSFQKQDFAKMAIAKKIYSINYKILMEIH